MNIQIFGTKKDFETKKAERYFKERGIRYQFIDMKEKAQNEELMRRLRQCLAADPVKTVLVDMTPLGLVEITRKKTLRPLHEQFSRSEKNR